MTIRKIIFITLLSALALPCLASPKQEAYIKNFSKIAKEEMIRTNIPASITLGLAAYLSDFGTNNPAIYANNHFHLKCIDLQENKFYDKETANDGTIINRCYKSFYRAEESFIQHSDFLTYNDDIASKLPFGDFEYKKWIKSLKKYLYTDDPLFFSELIKIIETHSLDKLDSTETIQDVVLRNSLKNNGVSATRAMLKDTPFTISAEFDIPINKILDFNDLEDENYIFTKGEIIYLEAKKNNFDGQIQEHYVQKGETIRMISNHYGIKASVLRKRNLIPENLEPAANEILKLNEQNNDTVKLEDSINTHSSTLNVDIPKTNRPQVTLASMGVNSKSLEDNSASKNSSNNDENVIYHIVKEGESLQTIAQKYFISVDKLVKDNKIQSDTIRIGQKLKIITLPF